MKLRWKRVPINSVYLGLYDGPHATPKPSEEGAVFLGIKNLTDDGHFDFSDIRHIAEEDYPRWTKRIEPRENDIVFTYEATLNRYALIPTGFRGCLGRRLALIRPDLTKVDPRFLFLYMFSEDWRRTIASTMVQGATVDRIPLIRFPDFPISLPDLPTQRKIANVLTSYDDLIENNNRRIALLEEMAQALYREWFVRFRFPGHENVPLIPSTLGEIPEAWSVLKLDAIQSSERYAIQGGPFGSKLGTKDYVDEGVPVIRGANLSESGRFRADDFVFVSEEKAQELRSNQAVPGDIVVTQRGTLGQIGMIPTTTGYDRFIISQSQMKITVDRAKAKSEYVFYFLKSPESNQRIKNMAISSGVPHINLGSLREFEIVLPPKPLQDRFAEVAQPIEDGIELHIRRNKVLRRTRDLLLPRLIAGQLDVEHLDIEVGEPVMA